MATAKKKTKTKTRARAKTRRTAKVSPVRGMPVSEWVKARVGGWQALVVKRLLAIAKEAAPSATVSIKWGQPIVEHRGPLAYIMPAKAHVTFGFWRGAELADEDRVLEGGGRMKHVKIKSADAIPESTLVTFVREAVRLNETKGDPTKRAKKKG